MGRPDGWAMCRSWEQLRVRSSLLLTIGANLYTNAALATEDCESLSLRDNFNSSLAVIAASNLSATLDFNEFIESDTVGKSDSDLRKAFAEYSKEFPSDIFTVNYPYKGDVETELLVNSILKFSPGKNYVLFIKEGHFDGESGKVIFILNKCIYVDIDEGKIVWNGLKEDTENFNSSMNQLKYRKDHGAWPASVPDIVGIPLFTRRPVSTEGD